MVVFEDKEQLKFLMEVRELPYTEEEIGSLNFKIFDRLNEDIDTYELEDDEEEDDDDEEEKFELKNLYKILLVKEKVVDIDNKKITERHFIINNKVLEVLNHDSLEYDYIDKGRIFYKKTAKKTIYLLNITDRELLVIVKKLNRITNKDIAFVIERANAQPLNEFIFLLGKEELEKAYLDVLEKFPKTKEEEEVEEEGELTTRKSENIPIFMKDLGLVRKGYHNNLLVGKGIVFDTRVNHYLKIEGFDLDTFIKDTYYDIEVERLLEDIIKAFRIKFSDYVKEDRCLIHFFKDNQLREFRLKIETETKDNRNRLRKLAKHYVIIDTQRYFIRKNLIHFAIKHILINNMPKADMIRFLGMLKDYTIRQIERLTTINNVDLELKEFDKMKVCLKFIVYHDREKNKYFWKSLDFKDKLKEIQRDETTRYGIYPLNKNYWGYEDSVLELFRQLKPFGITREELVDYLKVRYKDYQLIEQRAKKLLDRLSENNVKVEKIDEYNFEVEGENNTYIVSIAKPNRVEVKEKDTDRYICIVDNQGGERLNIYDRAITRILSLLNDEKMRKNIYTLDRD
jgi:hypothetical protein